MLAYVAATLSIVIVDVVAFGPFWCAIKHMSRFYSMPAMAHSPNYHVKQQRQIGSLRQSPFDSTVPVKPLHIADFIVTSKHSSDEAHDTNRHQSTTSHITYPRPAHSRSECSYGQPASLASERNRHVPLTGTKKPETVQEHRDVRYSREAGYAVQDTRVQDQLSSDRSYQVQPIQHTSYTYTCDESLDESAESRDHALWILVWLSCFCPLFSLIVCLYVIGALVITTALVPLHLCFSSRSYSQQIVRLLSSSLNAQIIFIRSSEVITSYSALMLVLVHVLSPFVSLGVAVAAWVAASFWFYAAIIGDPDGLRGKDDGRAAVVGVRSWWERWLMRASSSTVEGLA